MALEQVCSLGPTERSALPGSVNFFFLPSCPTCCPAHARPAALPGCHAALPAHTSRPAAARMSRPAAAHVSRPTAARASGPAARASHPAAPCVAP
ncbi:unnamed protein product [Closterium sp. NIES-54]